MSGAEAYENIYPALHVGGGGQSIIMMMERQ